MNDHVIDDLGRKISAAMQDLLNREMRIASAVLDSHDQLYLLNKLAAGVSAGAVLAGLQLRKEGLDPDPTYDEFADSLRQMVGALKPTYLDALRAMETKKAVAQ
ncbi:hypothetical protein COA17_11260 [Sphingomonas ginsenosidimutans]|jgi:hypothetical protein|uniref:Uncharacterized protein n=1 Tax=Sphingomonas ginsenosidimutans TaxID=862134 RepID=A0A2A4HW16_9SPHN|nr:hypothetical protein [Sphingomonas ginsenosidimutans]PCG08726.1 hypothetical protein COA17_11260 [Sphingomonas ginsenosidimutans]